MGLIFGIVVVGSGLLAGVYTAFTLMVIPALRRRPLNDAAATMVAINRRAERGPFIILFSGVAVAAAALAVSALLRGSAADGAIAFTSLASTVITISANVPLNRRLDYEGAAAWQMYEQRWTLWNTLRAVMAAAPIVVVMLTS